MTAPARPQPLRPQWEGIPTALRDAPSWALMGYEALQLPDGRVLCCRWGWCRMLRGLRDLARYLDREGIV